MEIETLVKTISSEIIKFSQSKRTIDHCLYNYEHICKELIGQIKLLDFEETHSLFGKLYEMQGFLAILTFKHDYDIGDYLHRIAFDIARLDDVESRRYWHNQIKEGNFDLD